MNIHAVQFIVVAACGLLLSGSAVGYAQDTATDQDALIKWGHRIYFQQCAGCHGDDGESTARGEGTKTLPGIYIRRTDVEIGHRLRGASFIPVKAEERAAVVAYVKTLKGKKGYARPEQLITTEALAPFIPDTGVRVVDLRPADAYAQAHIPNAAHMNAASLHPLPDAPTFARMMEKIGVGDNTYVVAYDNDGGRSAALFWSALQYYGHVRVSVLDGGWGAWTREKRYVMAWGPSKRTVTFTPRPQTDIFISDAEFKILIKTQKTLVLDAAGQDEKTSGQLGPVHLAWTNNLQPDGAFLPAEDLLTLYAAAGVKPDRRVVTISADQAQAAQAMFTLRLIGFPDVRIGAPISNLYPELSTRQDRRRVHTLD